MNTFSTTATTFYWERLANKCQGAAVALWLQSVIEKTPENQQNDVVLHRTALEEREELLRLHWGSIFTHLPSSFTLAAPWADVHHAAGQSANGLAPPAPPLTTARLCRQTLVSCCDWRDTRGFRRYSTQTSTKGKSRSKTLPLSHTAVETVSGQWFKTPSYPGNLFRWIKINGSLCLWMNLCLSISLFDDSVIVWTESLLLFCTFCNFSSYCCYLFWSLSSGFCVFVVVVSCVMLSSVWWWCCSYVYVSWKVLYQSF